MWLAEYFVLGDRHESVLGDITEQFQEGRSRLWFWTQVLALVLALLKKPSALLPLLLAAGALTLPYLIVLIFGPDPTGDEGSAAHTWQLLMVGQLACILVFLAKWAPREPRHAMVVLGVQVAAFLAAAAPVFLLGL
jgi:hypothetical protein